MRADELSWLVHKKARIMRAFLWLSPNRQGLETATGRNQQRFFFVGFSLAAPSSDNIRSPLCCRVLVLRIANRKAPTVNTPGGEEGLIGSLGQAARLSRNFVRIVIQCPESYDKRSSA
ncbi:hypothetical protein [Cardiobacterium hominis]|uniref:hypothetical protein n=1 Tax=Cardiobacterium hominis TaxID=2718 RepID=UPI0028D69F9C|nr:hypothetical protein [Cardiobacterium hominis]